MSGPDTGRGAVQFTDRVVEVVRSLSAGEVVTYGEVAAEAGHPGAARAVGRVLAGSGGRLPWWRVVTATGRLVPGLEAEQARRLEAEGVGCLDGQLAAPPARRSVDTARAVRSPHIRSSGGRPRSTPSLENKERSGPDSPFSDRT